MLFIVMLSVCMQWCAQAHMYVHISVHHKLGSLQKALWAKDEDRSAWSGTKRDCLWLL